MTDRFRLLVLLTADAVIAGALNPCAKIEVEALRQARHAVDDEAFAEASRIADLEAAVVRANEVARQAWEIADERGARLLGLLADPPRRKVVVTAGDQQWERWETVDQPSDPVVAGPTLAPLKPEPDAAVLGRARDALGASCATELIDAENLIYFYPQPGAVIVTEDGEARFAFVGDFPSREALQAANVPAGCYATCAAECLFRLGAAPIGSIDAAPRGDAAELPLGPMEWPASVRGEELLHETRKQTKQLSSDLRGLSAEMTALVRVARSAKVEDERRVDRPDPMQALDKVLADILTITATREPIGTGNFAALSRIDTLARNARRWLEMELAR